jgi:hypothetical protein
LGIRNEGFDAANRMGSARENGSLTLATYTYDTLSRRTGLAYGGGSSISYAYDYAGDMTAQGHTIPGGTSVSFTHTYNSARELSSTSSTAAAYLTGAGTCPALKRSVVFSAQISDRGCARPIAPHIYVVY